MKKVMAVLAVVLISLLANAVLALAAEEKTLTIIEVVEPLSEEERWVIKDDIDRLACLVYCEAGSNKLSDDLRYAVIAVCLNRVEDRRFPSSIKEVLEQKGQYQPFMRNGVQWPKKARHPTEAWAVARAYICAIKAYSKQVESPLRRAGYIWQANFQQGKKRVKIDNMWFGC
ncbi:cell wall hydrolase [bacterium]|nr:cell wall hydrolase [bacterium]